MSSWHQSLVPELAGTYVLDAVFLDDHLAVLAAGIDYWSSPGLVADLSGPGTSLFVLDDRAAQLVQAVFLYRFHELPVDLDRDIHEAERRDPIVLLVLCAFVLGRQPIESFGNFPRR